MSDPRVSSLMREREESSDVRRSTTSGFQTGNVIWILFYFYDRDTRRADRNRWAGRKLTNTSRWRSWTAPCQPLVVWSVKPNGIAIDPFRLLIPAVRSIVCWRKTTTFSPVNTPIGGKLQPILLFLSKFPFDFHFFFVEGPQRGDPATADWQWPTIWWIRLCWRITSRSRDLVTTILVCWHGDWVTTLWTGADWAADTTIRGIRPSRSCCRASRVLGIRRLTAATKSSWMPRTTFWPEKPRSSGSKRKSPAGGSRSNRIPGCTTNCSVCRVCVNLAT